MPDAAETRYTTVAIVLHWMIALGIIGMIALGWYMGDLEDRAQQYALTQLHKSFGISILLLSIARVIWRLMNPPPAEPPMPAWQAITARATHIAFYVLIIAMPLTGWIMVSASPTEIPTKLFQAIPWPHLPGLADMSPDAKDAFQGPIEFIHSKLAWVIIALLALHVGAALKHQFLDRDHLLARMIPGLFGKTSGPPAPARGGLAAFGAAFAIFAIAAAAPLLAGDGSNTAPTTPGPIAEQVASAPEAPPAPPEPPTIAQETTTPQPPETTAPTAEIAPPANPEPAQPAPQPVTAGPVPSWTVDPANSTLRFTAAYMGRDFSGKFDDWTARIAFDPERLEATDIRVEIAMASVNTGEPFYDENVVLGDWFNTRSFPQAVFAADQATALGGGRYRADGSLTIRDVTRPLALEFTLAIAGAAASVQGQVNIQRLDFSIGADTLIEARGDEDWVANQVRIAIDLRASRN